MRKNDPKQLEPMLEALLLEREFSQLSEVDRAYVSEQMSESEFEEVRMTLLASRALFEKEASGPNPALKGKLLQQFQQHHGKSTARSVNLKSLANRPVPLWQAVSGIAAAMLLLILFKQPKEVFIQGTPQIVYEYKTDTVFKEVPVQLASINARDTQSQIQPPRVVYRPTTAVNQKPGKLPAKADTVINVNPRFNEVQVPVEFSLAANDSADFQQVIRQYLPGKTQGRSLSADKELMDFITEVY